MAAIRLDGLTASAKMACPMDGVLFQTYVREALLPVLKPGDVVVMDNLASHKHPLVRERIESAGAKLLYLPPYSPDKNPIEPIWSKVKRLLPLSPTVRPLQISPRPPTPTRSVALWAMARPLAE